MVVYMTAGCYGEGMLTVVELAILYVCVSVALQGWCRGTDTACILQRSAKGREGELGIYCILVYWN